MGQTILPRGAPQRANIPQQNAVALQTGVMRGAVLLKTDTGQLQVVNMHPVGMQPVSSARVGGQQTFRMPAMPRPAAAPHRLLQPMPARYTAAPAQIRHRHPNMALASPGIVCVSQAQGMPAQQSLGVPMVPAPNVPVGQQLSIQAGTMAAGQAPASSPSQMSPNTAKKKCKNFLSTLIRLASDQPEHTATNVRCLIQALIDNTIQPEDFTNQLEIELNSSPQPCLIPFLRKSLPFLRHALLTKELTIEGVRPPPRSAICVPPPSTPMVRNLQKTPAARAGLQRTAGAQLQMMPPNALTAQLAGPVNLQGLLAQQQRFVGAVRPAPRVAAPTSGKSLLSKPASFAACLPPNAAAMQSFKVPAPVAPAPSKSSAPPTTGSSSNEAGVKEKRAPGPAILDDDINDVPTMGGVDLDAESETLLSSNKDNVEAQDRSCKDENFLFAGPLRERIAALAARHGIEEVPDDVVALVSHATQERLKTLIEKLSVIAEHRQENPCWNQRCAPTQDVRQQLRFLEELDKAEKRRHEEEEREMLLRAARSRSRAEDPEQLKLRQRARELQKAEQDEARQREANVTALLAIGPRKRPVSAIEALAAGGAPSASASVQPAVFRPRMKRVNARDVLFLLEQEKGNGRGNFVYKSYMTH